MNKTIEREFYVSDEDAGYMRASFNFQPEHLENTPNRKFKNKIKIIIEVPEKKVTISESEFDELFERFKKEHSPLFSTRHFVGILKQKLFSGDEG
jgi:hypothetical protein